MVDELIWQSDYDVGIPDIDDQHRMFLRLVGKIRAEKGSGADNEKMSLLLSELLKYAEYHFCSEENLMYGCNYPERAEHSRIHEEIIAELRNRVFAVKFDLDDYDSLEAFLFNWIVNHILKDDKAFAAYFRNV
ncbi:bacteriohemerythrin [Desulfosediminicola flagellatus]|uniref:bacteriohemerythrin n=1 Tax=Desulfosediminicola flagellatus TaxID=2569541 RepID=UPI0010ABABCB|nr:hemerythrin family protein [Desulfosediminicola flagellatus]